jgi:predicted small lipoprotein YifL
LLAATAALVLALGACGQKGPLYLPSQAGTAAKPAARLPSAPADSHSAAASAPLPGASAPGQPAAAN